MFQPAPRSLLSLPLLLLVAACDRGSNPAPAAGVAGLRVLDATLVPDDELPAAQPGAFRLVVRFDGPVDPTSISTDSFAVDSARGPVPGRYRLLTDARTATFRPTAPWWLGARYGVTVAGVRGADQRPQEEPFSAAFDVPDDREWTTWRTLGRATTFDVALSDDGTGYVAAAGMLHVLPEDGGLFTQPVPLGVSSTLPGGQYRGPGDVGFIHRSPLRLAPIGDSALAVAARGRILSSESLVVAVRSASGTWTPATYLPFLPAHNDVQVLGVHASPYGAFLFHLRGGEQPTGVPVHYAQTFQDGGFGPLQTVLAEDDWELGDVVLAPHPIGFGALYELSHPTWSERRLLARPGETPGAPEVAVLTRRERASTPLSYQLIHATDGSLHAAWLTANGEDVWTLHAAERPGEGPWVDRPDLVDVGEVTALAIAPDIYGNLTVAWLTEVDGQGPSLFAARHDAGEQGWLRTLASVSFRTIPDPPRREHITLVTDDRGHAQLFWGARGMDDAAVIGTLGYRAGEGWGHPALLADGIPTGLGTRGIGAVTLPDGRTLLAVVDAELGVHCASFR